MFALYLLLFATVLTLAAELGFLGIQAQTIARSLIANAQSYYTDHKTAFDYAFLAIGSSLSVVSASLAILRGFYYAERNLPVRLQELANKDFTKHLNERAELLSYMHAPFETQDFLKPVMFADPFSRMMNMFGLPSKHYRARREVCT